MLDIRTVFGLKALLVGSGKSGHSLRRVSHVLWASLTSPRLVITSKYFNDPVSIAAMQGSSSADYAVEAVLRFLEREFAEDGPKVVNEIVQPGTMKIAELCLAMVK